MSCVFTAAFQDLCPFGHGIIPGAGNTRVGKDNIVLVGCVIMGFNAETVKFIGVAGVAEI